MKQWLMPVVVTASAFLATSAMAESKLGDLSSFETIANDTLVLVNKGDMKAAEKRITDFETARDKAKRSSIARTRRSGA